MRVLILNTDYEAFLEDLYSQSPGLAGRTYDEQLTERSRSLFGVADFYSKGFEAGGAAAAEIHLNNRPMQLQWAFEHGLKIASNGHTGSHARDGFWRRTLRAFAPHAVSTPELLAMPAWTRQVLTAQIESFAPDVILNHVMHFVSAASLRAIAGRRCLIVGQIAAPWDDREDDRSYDLIVSSLPNYVSGFKARGIRSELNRLAFAPRVLDEVPAAAERDLAVSFVGTLSVHHADRISLLELLAQRVDLNVWGMGIEDIAPESPIRACYRGQAWGRDMYAIFRRSRIVVNQHIGIAGPFANNMRLYEATGCGATLVTDQKDNLQELFQPGSEVAAYDDSEECLEQIETISRDLDRCAEIGRSGQARTCCDHTYEKRTAELSSIFASIA
jgi:spore maturation protein CgeB